MISLASCSSHFHQPGDHQRLAHWALVSPVFVPMLMLLKIPPEATQAMYRIADSCTNALTPMSPYFVLALGFLQRYRNSAGIGTLPRPDHAAVRLTMLVTWTLFFWPGGHSASRWAPAFPP